MKRERLIPVVLVAAGLLAYHNSFTGEFIRDDIASIPENPTIRHLWPIWQPLSPPHRGDLTVENRPLINLSLAINYALGGYNVWGYHALNLTVHLLAGLTLLGIVRRTLLQPRLRERFGAAANELALATAVLWTVHPLQTESVTYVIQRAESIMGMFYLLTLYCFIRGVASPLVARSARDEPQPRLWYGLCIGACALGMASKEVMVSAPLMVLLYDRTFLSESFREAWRRRGPLYLALASTWILFGYLAIRTIGNALTNAQRIGLTGWQYLATEPGVILYYLRLSVWPYPLSFDFYGWPIAKTWMSILPPTIVVLILLGATAWAWRRNPVWGFVGAWFFLILAPSSSIIPAHDAIFEHRMYLSLAAVVSVVVMGLYSVAGRQSLAVFVVLAIGLGFLTCRRNQDYRSDITLRMNALTHNPNEPLLHYSLGVALQKAGRTQEAIAHYEQALRLNPRIAEVHNNLGTVLKQAGRTNDAIGQYEQALRLEPHYAEAHYNLGNALLEAGKTAEAIEHFRHAVRVKPDYAEAHNSLGLALVISGNLQEAVGHWEHALRLKPNEADVHYNLGNALLALDRVPDAVAHYEKALRLNPDYAEAHNNLGNVLLTLDRVPDAIAHYEKALRINPDYAEAHNNLGSGLIRLGRMREGIWHYEQALRINPDYAQAQNNLAWLLATLPPADGGDPARAVTLARRACEITHDHVAAYLDALGAAYAAAGRFNDAIAAAQQAIELARSDGQPLSADEIEARLQMYRSGRAYHQAADMSRP